MSHKATNWLSSLDPDELGHSEFRVLFHLCDCHNPAQGCFPTQAYLIAWTGASNGTVNNALNSLEAKGLIVRHRSRDGKSKRQNPTRYLLGFEIEKRANPSPNSGDGSTAKPSPNSGDGAVSNPEADPSPISGQSRLQPTGGEPVKEPVINQAGRKSKAKSDPVEWWANRVLCGQSVTPSAITAGMARDMVNRGLVTAGQLKAVGITI